MIWDLLNVRDMLSLTLRQTDGLGDQPFFAACAAGGEIDLRFGAPLDGVAKSDERVSLTLIANRVESKLTGLSEIYQPTGSMRAFARIQADDPVFALLATGKPVTLVHVTKKRVVWPAAAPRDVRDFVEACKTRSEH